MPRQRVLFLADMQLIASRKRRRYLKYFLTCDLLPPRRALFRAE